MIAEDTLRAAPKILLHDHLDGGLRPRTVVELAAETGYRDLPTTDPDELTGWFHRGADRRSLELYLETFAHTVGVLQTPEALRRVAAECAEDLAADGVVYAEVRFAPELHTEQGLALDEVVRAVLAGFADRRDVLQVGVLLSAMRTADRAAEVADLVVRHRGAGVVGMDLAGAEAGHPPTAHAAAFARLRDAGMPATVHAGESAGPESVAAALAVGARRLGHGVRIADDVGADGALGPVAASVRERGVPLELCPTSNLHTGAVARLEEHPIERLRRLGFAVTVNTDNRLMSDVTLTGELRRLVAAFAWDLDTIAAVTEQAAASTFLPVVEQERLLHEVIRPGYAALR
jgi:adenosine deaminase